MLSTFLAKCLSKFRKEKKLYVQVDAPKPENVTTLLASYTDDPLDPLTAFNSQSFEDSHRKMPKIKMALDFPIHEEQPSFVGDSAEGIIVKGKALDNCDTGGIVQQLAGGDSPYTIPPMLASYYTNLGFIGYQTCAYIAQHWLVNKVCSMPGDDAIRHGYEVNSADSDMPIPDEFIELMKSSEKHMKLNWTLSEFHRRVKVYGIQVAVPIIETKDINYYERPFNADAIPKDSYKGIKLVEPYWMVPMLTMESTSDPMSLQFYVPTYWIISGRKVHHSHVIVGKGPEVADILKPAYIFGGLPMTQMIYERVYAAERTANEAPLLSLSKRTTTMKTDLKKVAMSEQKFLDRLSKWTMFRDNYAVKVIGQDEEIGQIDTNLSDFDSIIMNQYQLVAAIGKVPATKLLGTQPKGFNSAGDYEELVYNEELESIQTNILTPMLDRHLICLAASNGFKIKHELLWHPVDTMTAEKLANVNKTKSDTGIALINAGVISPEEERTRLRDDKSSGYGRLQDAEAEEEIGMSPENIIEMTKAKAEGEKGTAAQTTAQARQTSAGAQVTKAEGESPDEDEKDVAAPTNAPDPQPVGMPENKKAEQGITAPKGTANQRALRLLQDIISALENKALEEGKDIDSSALANEGRAVKPNVKPAVSRNVSPSVASYGEKIGKLPADKLPKMKLNGMILKIENPRGTVRSGDTVDGNKWQVKMPHHYGFIDGVIGADNQELDCFVGQDLKSQKVFVVNQKDTATGEFDEHKVLLGFPDADSAKEAYTDSFEKGWDGFDSMVEFSIPEFKQWSQSAKQLFDPVSKNQFQVAPHPTSGVLNNENLGNPLGE